MKARVVSLGIMIQRLLLLPLALEVVSAGRYMNMMATLRQFILAAIGKLFLRLETLSLSLQIQAMETMSTKV